MTYSVNTTIESEGKPHEHIFNYMRKSYELVHPPEYLPNKAKSKLGSSKLTKILLCRNVDEGVLFLILANSVSIGHRSGYTNKLAFVVFLMWHVDVLLKYEFIDDQHSAQLYIHFLLFFFRTFFSVPVRPAKKL